MIAFGKNQSFYDFFVCQNYSMYKIFYFGNSFILSFRNLIFSNYEIKRIFFILEAYSF